MSVKRLLVIGVALGAGLVAAVLAMRMSQAPEAPAQLVTREVPAMESEDVLVASREIGLGAHVTAEQLAWAPWPKPSVTDTYITRSSRPNAIQELGGAVARAPFLAGEPIREAKLVKADRGFLSVILTPGMRAIAVEVKSAATAGGFILPNDRVDVLITRQAGKAAGNGDSHITETILTNVRVLAIDQNINEKRGETSVKPSETATLELSPAEAEILAQASQSGTLSLALRSIADSEPDAQKDDGELSGTVKVVRFGVPSRVSTKR